MFTTGINPLVTRKLSLAMPSVKHVFLHEHNKQGSRALAYPPHTPAVPWRDPACKSSPPGSHTGFSYLVSPPWTCLPLSFVLLSPHTLGPQIADSDNPASEQVYKARSWAQEGGTGGWHWRVALGVRARLACGQPTWSLQPSTPLVYVQSAKHLTQDIIIYIGYINKNLIKINIII